MNSMLTDNRYYDRSDSEVSQVTLSCRGRMILLLFGYIKKRSGRYPNRYLLFTGKVQIFQGKNGADLITVKNSFFTSILE